MWGFSKRIATTNPSSKIFNLVPQLDVFITMTRKPYHQNKSVKRHKNASKPANDGSNEKVLLVDVKSLLSRSQTANLSPEWEAGNNTGGTTKTSYALPEKFLEVEVTISELCSTSDGLSPSSISDHVYIIPFIVASDVVKVKAVNYFP